MSQLYSLKITIPHDAIGFPKVQEKLATASYTKKYGMSVAYPNIIEYTISPLSQTGVDNVKKLFRDAFSGANPDDKKHCGFSQETFTP